MEEEAVKEPWRQLCLVLCPRCMITKYRGGACHLLQGHADRHECNAVGGETHTWREGR